MVDAESLKAFVRAAADLLQEGRNWIDLEDVNGYKIIRGLIDAAEAGGGFVEYYWDNPAIEGDEEAGLPKVSYAEGFTGRRSTVHRWRGDLCGCWGGWWGLTHVSWLASAVHRGHLRRAGGVH